MSMCKMYITPQWGWLFVCISIFISHVYNIHIYIHTYIYIEREMKCLFPIHTYIYIYDAYVHTHNIY